jgi:hypothetical protein
MNLTEPQAGSDVGAVRTKAVRQDDGTYRITGNKIFITFGEHDLAENIIHLVLARTPDAPPGTKGISCFIVPKFLLRSGACRAPGSRRGVAGSSRAWRSFGGRVRVGGPDGSRPRKDRHPLGRFERFLGFAEMFRHEGATAGPCRRKASAQLPDTRPISSGSPPTR